MFFSSTDHVIQQFSSNFTNPTKKNVFSTHSEPITSIDISHDGLYLLSSSEDKSCKLWSLKSSNNIIDIKSIKKSDSTCINFDRIYSALFFYMDKFILISNGNSFLLCKYFIDMDKNDLQR